MQIFKAVLFLRIFRCLSCRSVGEVISRNPRGRTTVVHHCPHLESKEVEWPLLPNEKVPKHVSELFRGTALGDSLTRGHSQ
jgi:hypothetical protein